MKGDTTVLRFTLGTEGERERERGREGQRKCGKEAQRERGREKERGERERGSVGERQGGESTPSASSHLTAGAHTPSMVQGYLAHKKLEPPWGHHRALGMGLL